MPRPRRRAFSSFERDDFDHSLKIFRTRLHAGSEQWRRRVRGWRRTARAAPSAKLVSASASSTTARSPASAARTSARISPRRRRPVPAPRHCGGASLRNSVSSAAPSTGRTITARFAAALTSSASRGEAMVTRPAPARSAPRAASRAAPVERQPAGDHDSVAASVFVSVACAAPGSCRPRAAAH